VSGFLVYLAFRIGGGLVGALPEVVMRKAGEWGGALAWTWAKPRKAMAVRHMRRVLGSEAAQADVEQAARAMFRAYGRYWAETFWFRPRRAKSIRKHTTLIGAENLERVRDRGDAMIVALPHMGNWEMAATAGDTLGVRVTAVAELLNNPRVVKWFLDMRESVGIDIVLTGQGSSTMRALLEAINDRRVVALLSDRDVTGSGILTEFFGEETTLPAGPAALSTRTGAPIIPVASFFKTGRGHRIVIGEPIEPPDGDDREQRIAEQTRLLAAALEDLIRQGPSQWHIVQPNWPSDRLADHDLTSGSV
jgi:KDO2-lipid IV(A) lauroyltransferase